MPPATTLLGAHCSADAPAATAPATTLTVAVRLKTNLVTERPATPAPAVRKVPTKAPGAPPAARSTLSSRTSPTFSQTRLSDARVTAQRTSAPASTRAGEHSISGGRARSVMPRRSIGAPSRRKMKTTRSVASSSFQKEVSSFPPARPPGTPGTISNAVCRLPRTRLRMALTALPTAACSVCSSGRWRSPSSRSSTPRVSGEPGRRDCCSIMSSPVCLRGIQETRSADFAGHTLFQIRPRTCDIVIVAASLISS